MSGEHIGQRQQIGLGKETTSGTNVSATNWFAKTKGEFVPKTKVVYDDGAFGSIDEFKSGQTVQNYTEIDVSGIADDTNLGHILMALLCSESSCVKFPIPGAITGTYVEGETITESTSNATGVLKRADVGGSSKVLYITVATGTFTGGQTLTGGTSSATATGGSIESPSAVRNHLFRRATTNNPTTYTIHGYDPVSSDYSAYCALDTLKFEVKSGEFARFDAKFMGKKLVSESPPTPSYTSPNYLMAKYATLKTASGFTGLDAASAVSVESVTFDFKKNIDMFQAVGSTDITNFLNKQFSVQGTIVLLYNATTYRDYMIGSTKRAMRLTIANTDVTIGSAANPTLQLDLASVAFTDFSRPTGNKDLIKQTLKFTAEYDLTTTHTIQALLQNTQTAAY